MSTINIGGREFNPGTATPYYNIDIHPNTSEATADAIRGIREFAGDTPFDFEYKESGSVWVDADIPLDGNLIHFTVFFPYEVTKVKSPEIISVARRFVESTL